jgi:hypothetical protein
MGSKIGIIISVKVSGFSGPGRIPPTPFCVRLWERPFNLKGEANFPDSEAWKKKVIIYITHITHTSTFMQIISSL